MREKEELYAMGKKLMTCNKETLPSIDEVEFHVKERKEEKMQKIRKALQMDNHVTMICGIPVMINYVSERTAEEALADYIQSFARITY